MVGEEGEGHLHLLSNEMQMRGPQIDQRLFELHHPAFISYFLNFPAFHYHKGPFSL
jgi:hypothetical protein